MYLNNKRLKGIGNCISFNSVLGFCGEHLSHYYNSDRIFIAELDNTNMKSFKRNIYWDHKKIERMKALGLFKVHPYTPPEVKNERRKRTF